MELQIRDVSTTYPNGVQALKDVTLAPHLARALADYHGRERRFGACLVRHR